MTKSCIICEGTTDCFFLEYFMMKVYSWKDDKIKNTQVASFNNGNKWKRNFFQEGKMLTILESDGSTNLPFKLGEVLQYNLSGIDEEFYQKIVIFTDNDEVGTYSIWKKNIEKILKMFKISFTVADNVYTCKVTNFAEESISFSIILVLVPFDENGAIETFLLNSIKKKDAYDGDIIDKGNHFVDTVDEEKKYLNHRRIITKAKFDVYFSIRTPYKAFAERRNILKDVPWEDYLEIRKEFSVLGEL